MGFFSAPRISVICFMRLALCQLKIAFVSDLRRCYSIVCIVFLLLLLVANCQHNVTKCELPNAIYAQTKDQLPAKHN